MKTMPWSRDSAKRAVRGPALHRQGASGPPGMKVGAAAHVGPGAADLALSRLAARGHDDNARYFRQTPAARPPSRS